ncbi:Transcriptional repressor NrdR, partial [Bienertia sinuspersici]
RGCEQVRVPVKYERLPLICFICGKIGHGDRECDVNNNDYSPEKKYGTWLRASPWRPKIQEKKSEKEEEGRGRRRLFVAKPDKSDPIPEEAMEGMLKKLGGVDLNNSYKGDGGNSNINNERRQRKVNNSGKKSKGRQKR